MKGIKYQINGRNYFVRFRYFNGRIVKCFLDDADLFMTFVGKSKLNVDDGDVYSKEEGEKVALQYALDKRSKYIDGLKLKLFMDLDGQKFKDSKAIIEKIAREQIKFRKKEAKKIAWEQQQKEFETVIQEAMDMLDKDLGNLIKNETDN